MTPVKFEVDALVFDVHICSKHYKPIGVESFSIGPIVPNTITACLCNRYIGGDQVHEIWCKHA